MKHKIKIHYNTFTIHEVYADKVDIAVNHARTEAEAILKGDFPDLHKEILQNATIPSDFWCEVIESKMDNTETAVKDLNIDLTGDIVSQFLQDFEIQEDEFTTWLKKWEKLHKEDKHKRRHKLLHNHLNQLLADMMGRTGVFPSQSTVLDLLNWSYEQTINPTEKW